MTESLVVDFRPPMDSLRAPDASLEGEGEERAIHRPRSGDGIRQESELWETTYIIGGGLIDLRLVSFLLLIIAVILTIVFIISDVMEQHREYSRRTGFPGPEMMIIGSVVTLSILALVCYNVYITNDYTRLYIFWFLILYLLFMVLWIFNLAVRAEKFIRQLIHTNGFNFLFVADLFLLGLLVITYHVCPQYSFLLAIPVVWNIYLTYHWLFSVK